MVQWLGLGVSTAMFLWHGFCEVACPGSFHELMEQDDSGKFLSFRVFFFFFKSNSFDFTTRFKKFESASVSLSSF